MVVRANILGTVVGPSTQDPWRRITVAFSFQAEKLVDSLIFCGEMKLTSVNLTA